MRNPSFSSKGSFKELLLLLCFVVLPVLCSSCEKTRIVCISNSKGLCGRDEALADFFLSIIRLVCILYRCPSYSLKRCNWLFRNESPQSFKCVTCLNLQTPESWTSLSWLVSYLFSLLLAYGIFPGASASSLDFKHFVLNPTYHFFKKSRLY